LDTRFDMRRRLTFTVLTLLLTAAAVRAEIIDRIVAVVDNNFLIMLSDIRQERAIQVALGRAAESDDAVMESLIEKHIFEQQIARFRDIDVKEDEVTQQLKGVQVPTGLSEEDIRRTLRDEIRRYEFNVQRFRPFVKVSDDEAHEYYEKILLPKLKAAGTALPTAEEGIESARTILIVDKMNKEVDDWLKDLKGRASIEKISK
jgi:hypothetical protein